MSESPTFPAAQQASALLGRCLRLSVRNVDALMVALMLPIILMLMFVYLFGGSIHTGVDYVDFVVPGVLLVCAGFGVGTAAVSVSADLSGSVVDRFRSMGVRGETLLGGHVVATAVRTLASAVVVFAVAFAIGFRSSAAPAAWVASAGVLAAYLVAMCWVCAALGTLASSAEAATGLTFLVSFLAYPSSAFVPIDTMPSWLQGFARDQPVTAVVDSLRGLLVGGPVAGPVWHALAWSGGITVGAAVLCGVLFRRRTG